MINKQSFYYKYNKNSPANKYRHIGPIDARLFLRDLSLPFAYEFAKRKINPDLVTYLFLSISMVGILLFIVPSFWTIISLILLLETAQLLDCVDGQLARYYDTISQRGENLDTIAHIATDSLFLMSFGLRLYFSTHLLFFAVIGFIGGLSKTLDHYQIITHTSVLDNQVVKRFYEKSTYRRYIIYVIKSLISEVRIFGALLVILYLLDRYFGQLHLVEISFITLACISIAENYLYTFLRISRKYILKSIITR